MHWSRAPYRYGLFKTVDDYCEAEFYSTMCYLFLKLCIRVVLHIAGQRPFYLQVHMKTPFRPSIEAKILFCWYYVVQHPRRWIYQEGILVSGSSRTSPSSLYSSREIVPERDLISLIDLSDSETVEGPIAQGVEPGVSIKEDPKKAESDAGMLPELEGAALVAAEGTDTLVASRSLFLLPVPSVEAASQQMASLREEISQMDAFCYTARQAHLQAIARVAILESELAQLSDIYDTFKYEDALRVTFVVFNTMEWQRIGSLEFSKLGYSRTNYGPGMISKKNSKRSTYLSGLRAELQWTLAPLPPMGFTAAVEAVTRTKMADRAVTQWNAAIGSATTSYKRPGQGPWTSRDSKRSRGKQKIGSEGWRTQTLEESIECLG
ncbi:hypothetical protein M9H77_23798 [Catharanthus roseus]|uniref:Uncharacterized protein n=1 Tax=Catharanthus roseus TaxID=4058 RepID=A0ACC0AW21_CATRO|nr:hypothetical protein M9H77_23798 [Catharanthus roseus]